jgi:hypothetical protein
VFYFVNQILCLSLIKMVTYPVGMESSSSGNNREGGLRLNSQLSLVLRFRMFTAIPYFPLYVALGLTPKVYFNSNAFPLSF